LWKDFEINLKINIDRPVLIFLTLYVGEIYILLGWLIIEEK
jgi:hypothetical protein